MAATTDGDERVMAAAQHILKSLGTRKDDTEDMIFILSSFDNRLSAITDLLSKSGGTGLSKTEERLEAAEKVIRRWDSASDTPHHHSSPWEDSPDEAAEYLSAVDDILGLTEDPTVTSDGGVMDRAESVLQLAMSKLEDEFRYILIRNAVPLDAGRLSVLIRRLSVSLTTNDGDIDDTESTVEEEHESFSEVRVGSFGDNLFVDLITPEAIDDLREIADRMIRSRYEKECCQAYSSVRRDFLQDFLCGLGIEKLSIEEVQKIDWRSLDEKMKKWIQAVKTVTRFVFPGEMRLCERVFGGSGLIRDVCFTESAKGCMMQLLNFGEAIAIGQRSPERLSRILDMYEALSVALPELQELFSDDSGHFIYSEAEGVLAGLGEAAKGAFAELQNAVQGEGSRKQKSNQGEIHPVTRYVMNYMKLLVDYSDSLNQIMDDDSVDVVEGGDNNLQPANMSPVGRSLLSLISCLESNLDEKSKLYEDGAMQNVFLMNNILYIVQKVKDSELGKLLGDQWVRKRRGLIRQYSTGYLRASWSKVLSCLKDEGLGGGGSSSNVSKPALKERFKNFNLCFEEIYRTQTAWKVPDPQLREELRILISEKVIPAYRAFLGRFGSHLDSGRHAGKYIKYTPEDLEEYLLDLFEGSPLVIHNLRRKIST